ncbi:SbtR family transcriptional regulator [Streptomyces lydicus]|uniref:SbtR family transcriptional regulator n=1 Tax=Streptomyces lydicus TaxID=47763 RepID=UPI0036F00353
MGGCRWDQRLRRVRPGHAWRCAAPSRRARSPWAWPSGNRGRPISPPRRRCCPQATTDALADPDPWNGFTGYIEAVCAMQAADRGFADILTMSFPGAQGLEALRAQAYQGFLELIGRAKDSGHLREDFTSRDLVLLLMANAGVLSATGDAAPDAWRRFVAWMIHSFQAPARGELPDPPEDAALYEAMRRASHSVSSPEAEKRH